MFQSLVYPDLTRPKVNRILANLIYFDFIGSWNLSWQVDKRVHSGWDCRRDRERHRRLSNLTLPTWSNYSQVWFSGICFSFFFSEIGTQTENKIIFKINLNCGIFWWKLIRDRIWTIICIWYLTSIFGAYPHSHVITCHIAYRHARSRTREIVSR
jgi:hypothetical protein